MKIPVIKGVIDRRILVNFTVDPDTLQKVIPPPFRPKLYKGKAIAGICLIRLKQVRPKWLPGFMGIPSENAAHRIAVEWTEKEKIAEGVFIPRRDTSSILNTVAGGRIFPGRHFHTKFDIKEENSYYHVAFSCSDGTRVAIDACETDSFNTDSIFKTLDNASMFFKEGSLGYSPGGTKFDGLLLKVPDWNVKPLKVISVYSSFFENEAIFPKGAVQFDNALLMTGLQHEWHSAGTKTMSSL